MAHKKATNKEIVMQALIKLAEHNKDDQKRFNEIIAVTSYIGEMWNDGVTDKELKPMDQHPCPQGQEWSSSQGKCVDSIG